MDSILLTIKKLLGIPEEVTEFDTDVTVAINTSLNFLTQMGVGPQEGFRIVGSDERWDEFLGDDPRLDQAKDYIFIKVKLMFDSSQMSSMVIDSYNKIAQEIEWRLSAQTDPSNFFEGGE